MISSPMRKGKHHENGKNLRNLPVTIYWKQWSESFKLFENRLRHVKHINLNCSFRWLGFIRPNNMIYNMKLILLLVVFFIVWLGVFNLYSIPVFYYI